MSTVDLVRNSPDKILPEGGVKGGGSGEGGKGTFYLEPNTPEVIEMRGGINFSRLPQDPPPTEAIHMQSNGSVVTPDVPTIIAPTANGTSPKNSIDTYGNVSGQRPDMEQAVTTFGHLPPQPSEGVSAPRPPRPPSQYKHTYEQLPTHHTEVSERLDENGHSPYGHNGHMSHTEVDQAMLYPNSTSKVHLTGKSGSMEKRPRKKMNPVYDGYQGSGSTAPSRKKTNPAYESYQGKVISTKGSSKPPQHHGSPVKQCSSCSVKCLKSPCTTFLVILVVFLMVMAGVLIFMGKITTPATGGGTSELSQPKPSTPNPSYTPIIWLPEEVQQRLVEQDTQIQQMQEQIQMLQNLIDDLLGGSDENVNASLSTKVMQNSRGIERVEEEQTDQLDRIKALAASVHSDQVTLNHLLSEVENLKTRTTNLESNSTSLDTRVKQLTATSETQTTVINEIQRKNTEQDTKINNIESKLSLVEQEYKFELSALNRTIYGELEDISKMPGPRGYNGSQGPMGEPGAGNLTQCLYGKQTQVAGVGVTTTETPWVAADENYIFTGLTCSTRGGTSTNLEQVNVGIFKCTCSGNNADRDDQFGRDCSIHFWKCPTIS